MLIHRKFLIYDVYATHRVYYNSLQEPPTYHLDAYRQIMMNNAEDHIMSKLPRNTFGNVELRSKRTNSLGGMAFMNKFRLKYRQIVSTSTALHKIA